jgi:hypothetical protein
MPTIASQNGNWVNIFFYFPHSAGPHSTLVFDLLANVIFEALCTKMTGTSLCWNKYSKKIVKSLHEGKNMASGSQTLHLQSINRLRTRKHARTREAISIFSNSSSINN